jgi:diacylglycerol kinase (ATP)
VKVKYIKAELCLSLFDIYSFRVKNKVWYFEFGATENFFATCKNLHEKLDIMCDGCSLDLANGPTLEGIAILNIPSIYGGSNLWGENPSQKKRKKITRREKDREYSTSSISSIDLNLAIQGELKTRRRCFIIANCIRLQWMIHPSRSYQFL